MAMMREQVTEYIKSLQKTIVTALEELDPGGASIQSERMESWRRWRGKGLHLFRTPLVDADVHSGEGSREHLDDPWETASSSHQMATEHASVEWNDDLNDHLPFFAGGISVIIHPRSPNLPSAHANYRYFEVLEGEQRSEQTPQVRAWWFGGITDLTPSYVFKDDFKHFHATLKKACDSYGPDLYPSFKKCCDDYYFIKHRNEHRGIGGLRFDDLCDKPHTLLTNPESRRPYSASEIFEFIQSLANAFIPSILPTMHRRAKDEWTEQMRRWQLIRRGRIIEFNLVYDRGTKFGLATPGVQAENVLVSFPEAARWEYMSELGVEGDGTKEGEMTDILKHPIDWAAA